MMRSTMIFINIISIIILCFWGCKKSNPEDNNTTMHEKKSSTSSINNLADHVEHEPVYETIIGKAYAMLEYGGISEQGIQLNIPDNMRSEKKWWDLVFLQYD